MARLPFRVPQLHFLSRLGPRTRKVLRYVGIGLFGLVVFVFALQMSLPVDRAKEKVIEAVQDKLDITIGSVERGWMPGRIYLNNVSVRTRPKTADEPVTTFYVERLKADVGLLALVGGNLKIDAVAKIGAGRLDAHVVLHGLVPVGHKGITVHLEGTDLPSASLPAKLATNGLPMSGKVDLTADLDLPKEKNKQGVLAFDFSKAEGELELECPNGCSFGDGKSKWKPMVKNHSQQAMVSDGIEIEPIDVTKLDAKIEIKDGHAKVVKLDAPSPDAELKLDFDLKLAPVLDDSIVTGCVRFKIADGLFKRKPKAEGAIRNTGAELRNDGYFHIKLADTWRDMKRLNAECGPNAKPEGGTEGAPGGGFRPAARPNLTVMPDEAKPPTPGGVPQPVNVPTPAPPPPVMPTRPATEVVGSGGSAAAPPGSGEGGRERERDHREEAPGSAGSAGSAEGSAPAGGPANQVLQKR